MYLSTDAIVLKNINYRDSSIISRIYTLERGKISIISKGIKKNKKNIIATMEPSNIINITYYDNSKSNLKISKEVYSKVVFSNNRKQLDTYYYSMAIISLVDTLCEEGDSNFNLYNLIVNSLGYINKHVINKELIFLYFLINLNSTLGCKIILNSSNDFDNKSVNLFHSFDNSFDEFKINSDKMLATKDFIKKIKRVIYLNMRNNLIDLNTIHSIKMLKKITDGKL